MFFLFWKRRQSPHISTLLQHWKWIMDMSVCILLRGAWTRLGYCVAIWWREWIRALSQQGPTYNEVAENSELSHFAVPTTNWKGSSYWLKPSMLDMEIFTDELTISKNSSRLVIMTLLPALFLSRTFTFRYYHIHSHIIIYMVQVIQQREKNHWRWDTWCLRVITGRQEKTEHQGNNKNQVDAKKKSKLNKKHKSFQSI